MQVTEYQGSDGNGNVKYFMEMNFYHGSTPFGDENFKLHVRSWLNFFNNFEVQKLEKIIPLMRRHNFKALNRYTTEWLLKAAGLFALEFLRSRAERPLGQIKLSLDFDRDII